MREGGREGKKGGGGEKGGYHNTMALYVLFVHSKNFHAQSGLHLSKEVSLSRKLIVAPEYSLLQPFVLMLHTLWCWKYGRGPKQGILMTSCW